jgi:uncharacterized protein
MTTTEFGPGTPCWVDLGTPDPQASAAFYSGLFGWEAAPGPEEASGYTFCLLGGKPVAAVGGLMEPGARPRWLMYVQADDADAAAREVAAAGGATRMGPMDVFDLGRAAYCTDDGGAEFAVWQPRDFKGAGVVGEPGSMCWAELNTRDAEAASAFYGKVFGWTGEAQSFAGTTYTQLATPGGKDKPFGGILQMNEEWPQEIPQHWMVYFETADCDATAAKAAELGGSVAVPPFSALGVGRIAVLNDPHGAYFSVITSAQRG